MSVLLNEVSLTKLTINDWENICLMDPTSHNTNIANTFNIEPILLNTAHLMEWLKICNYRKQSNVFASNRTANNRYSHPHLVTLLSYPKSIRNKYRYHY